MISRSYLEAPIGPHFRRLPRSPVVVLQRWGHVDSAGKHRPSPGAPRNVLIRRADGTLVVRPFRGLRKS